MLNNNIVSYNKNIAIQTSKSALHFVVYIQTACDADCRTNYRNILKSTPNEPEDEILMKVEQRPKIKISFCSKTCKKQQEKLHQRQGIKKERDKDREREENSVM